MLQTQENEKQTLEIEQALENLTKEDIAAWFQEVSRYVTEELFTVNALYQAFFILLGFGFAWAMRPWCRKAVSLVAKHAVKRFKEDALHRSVDTVLFALMWLFIVSAGLFTMTSLGLPVPFLRIGTSLLTAWIVIRLVSSFIAEPFWAKTVATTAWAIAALNIFGMLDPTVRFLDAFAVNLGGTRVSILLVVQAIFLVAVLLWLATFLSGAMQKRIDRLPSLTPSIRILIGNVSRITLIAIALFVALTSLGIDLSVLAVLGGAIGIGIGFGLQKIVGNFISGLILLLDRSIKPGDVIEVAGTYGWVKSLGARYTSVVTRDGHEHLIPNEDFIVNTVTNWSFSDEFVRVKKPIGIAYDMDVRQAMDLVVEAANSIPRVLDNPAPKCLLKGFGDSSIDLEVRFWLKDPANGVSNVSSEVLLAVWDKFQEAGIEIPYPKRDVYIKEGGA